MRTKTIFYCLVLFAISFHVKAQWVQLNSGTTNDLYDVHFPVPDTGYAVGIDGIILKTTNGGSGWISLGSFSYTNTLYSIFFINANNGFAVGDSGTILKTVDGGINWINQNSNTQRVLSCVYFTNSDIGYAGGHGLILKTNDSGSNWYTTVISHTTNSTIVVRGIHFPVPDTGYAVASRDVLRSIDAGEKWVIIADHPPNNDNHSTPWEDCEFTDANTGFIVGTYGTPLLTTTNGGNNWNDIMSVGQLRDLFSIDFFNKKIGYSVGWRGIIVKTTDGGNNWIVQESGSSSTLYSVHFSSAYTGYAVGENGTILKTTNVVLEEKDKVFPNPFTNMTTIVILNKLKNNEDYIQFTLYDVLARQG